MLRARRRPPRLGVQRLTEKPRDPGAAGASQDIRMKTTMSTSTSERRAGFWTGRDGLRPAWALSLFVVTAALAACIPFGAAYLLGLVTLADLQGVGIRLVPRVALTVSLSQVCGVLVAYGVMCRIDRRPWRAYGLGAARALSRLGLGALTGALAMSLLVGAMVLTHGLKTGASGLPAHALIGWGLLWAALFLSGACVEEMMFRGFPFLRLVRVTTPSRAAIVMSVIFGLLHLQNRGETLIGILQVITFGLVMCLAVWRTGSLWWSFGAHAAWNWTQTFVFGCSNSGLAGSGGQWLVSAPAGPLWLSGGTTGPEGGVLVFPVLALMAGIIVLTLPLEPRSPEAEALPTRA